jgi:hypothetical protein
LDVHPRGTPLGRHILDIPGLVDDLVCSLMMSIRDKNNN